MLRSATAWLLCLALAAPTGAWAQAIPAQERTDLATIHRIKQEAFSNSQVMDTLLHLTDHIGPRLTGSPEYKRSADWVISRLKEYGIDNGRLEKFDFGRGWSYSRFSAHMIEPSIQPLIGFPMAWTSGTNGTVTGEVVYVPMTEGIDFAKWRGKLKDKIVLIDKPREFPLETTPQARRHAESDLNELLQAPDPGRPTTRPSAASGRAFRNIRNKFLREEGVLLALSPGYQGTYGTVFAAAGASHELKSEIPPPIVAIASEHYSRMVRLIENKIPVKVEANVQAQFHENGEGYNVVAELPGTGKHKDEYILIGGHLDSWQGATGATDNAAACAAMIEVLRLFKTTGIKLDRTVRIGLWGGEEQGLYGSKAYVKDHLADRETMKLGKEHGKLSVYLNVDNGAGKIRGIYAQGNDMAKPIFEALLAPFKDLGVTHVTNRNTGGTDHLSFDAVGVPGFQFIQDPLDYMPRTHHSNMDTYDRIQKGDMLQMVAVLASVVYHAANRDEMFPRKPLPAPEKKKDEPKPATPPSASSAGQL
jgi:carboxypeptidase Q